MNVIDEAYWEPYQASKMKRFVKIVNGFQMLTIFTYPYTEINKYNLL